MTRRYLDVTPPSPDPPPWTPLEWAIAAGLGVSAAIIVGRWAAELFR